MWTIMKIILSYLIKRININIQSYNLLIYINFIKF